MFAKSKDGACPRIARNLIYSNPYALSKTQIKDTDIQNHMHMATQFTHTSEHTLPVCSWWERETHGLPETESVGTEKSSRKGSGVSTSEAEKSLTYSL